MLGNRDEVKHDHTPDNITANKDHMLLGLKDFLYLAFSLYTCYSSDSSGCYLTASFWANSCNYNLCLEHLHRSTNCRNVEHLALLAMYRCHAFRLSFTSPTAGLFVCLLPICLHFYLLVVFIPQDTFWESKIVLVL